MIAALAATACGQGAYPLDIFYEMHYQQTYKSQEPPRMSGVEGAVAWYPAQGATTTFGADGEYLFNVNCSMCHGAQAKGDGPVLQMLIDEYGYTPLVTPDLTSELVVTMGRGGNGRNDDQRARRHAKFFQAVDPRRTFGYFPIHRRRTSKIGPLNRQSWRPFRRSTARSKPQTGTIRSTAMSKSLSPRGRLQCVSVSTARRPTTGNLKRRCLVCCLWPPPPC